ncbi:IS66 family transposase [Variovorax sp. J22R24]|uniref:IS66 family transposase n=1 Tax=Variovorax gracilis TaxID=3053502 RepID=UPI00257819F4|nr:IS66 family transposase [Variovorax sp. J22R24]MDM0110429.1 IS66 family transposase [Variovorax sp. J22R24]
MLRMLGTQGPLPIDLAQLPPEAAALIAQMQQRLEQQDQQLAEHVRELAQQQSLLERKDRELALRQTKIEKINFELARLKRWKFGAKSEAMTAEQRQLFQDTVAEDEASLQAQLAALQASLPEASKTPKAPARKPRRQALPQHLRRVEHRHEPEDTTCGCGQSMVRVGEDISEKLDIVPAEFFVHRHIYGKWACRCCQSLKQEAAAAEIVDGGIPASGLVAHTLISRFVDHLPYYRQETINARSGVHTPRSTLAAWAGYAGAALEPLYDAHKRFVLRARVLHADETPVALLDPGAGKTRRAYVWAYARGELDVQGGVIFEFCLGRGGQYPVAFLSGEDGAWNGTLLTDQYAGYDSAMDARVYPMRVAAGCVVHARRKYDEVARAGTSPVAEAAIKRLAQIYHLEGSLATMPAEHRHKGRQECMQWDGRPHP